MTNATVKSRCQRAQDGGKHLHISHLNLNEISFPKQVFSLSHLLRLDISFNNLRFLDSNISKLTKLRELWLNNNPLIELPVSMSSLPLKVLDCRDTMLFNLPREFARLKHLTDLNLDGVPLKWTIKDAYDQDHPEGLQKGPLFKYLHRKNDRRRFKQEFLRACREQIYPFDDPVKVEYKVTDIFNALKHCTSDDLRKLVRHAARILPEDVNELDPEEVSKLVAMLKEEEETRFTVGQVQLSLVSIFPDCPLDQAHHLADELVKHLDEDTRKEVFKKSAVLFPKSYVDLNPMGLKVTLEQYNLSRRHAWFKSRLQSHFRDATEEIVDALFDEMHKLVDGDLELLATCMMPTLGNLTVHEAMGQLKEGDLEVVLPKEPLTIEQVCIEVHAKYRETHGAYPLEWSEELAEAAEAKANELAEIEDLKATKDEIEGDGQREHDVDRHKRLVELQGQLSIWTLGPPLTAPAQEGQEGGEAEGEAEIPTGQCVHVTGIEEISDSFLDEVAEVVFSAIETWYMERTHEPAEGEESEQLRFRQVVWKATTSVGMAVSSDGKYLVALYSPAGNTEGGFEENVLPEGTPLPAAEEDGGFGMTE
jgi:hypothetical protein